MASRAQTPSRTVGYAIVGLGDIAQSAVLPAFANARRNRDFTVPSGSSISSAITLCVYTFCSLAAGIAGLIISSNVKSADANNAGQLLELDAILAVTLGGTALTGGKFSLAGTVIGALIIQTLTSMIYSLGVPPEVNLVVKAALVFAVMLLQSPEFRGLVLRVARRRPA